MHIQLTDRGGACANKIGQRIGQRPALCLPRNVPRNNSEDLSVGLPSFVCPRVGTPL